MSAGPPTPPPADAGDQPGHGQTRWLLALALVLAAGLRFAHLDQGLRHTPHMDEQYFVRNVARMLETGSFDHGFYEYPGLLFYLLAPVLALAQVGDPPGASAYLAARALIAAFGVLSVALVYFFGARLAGRTAGLCAAFFLALSPVHVETAHMLRPDVALEAFTLLALTALLRLGRTLRHDARAGAALGLAVGLKFSAGLLAVPYVTQRLLRAGPRLRGLLLGGAVAALVFVAVSPYAVVRHAAFGAGVTTQIAYHYQAQPEPPAPYPARFAGYAAVWPKALGPLGALLALAGVVLVLSGRPRPVGAEILEQVRSGLGGAAQDPLVAQLVGLIESQAQRPAPRPRDWLPFLLLPPLTAAVFATTPYHFDRHMLPSLGIVALLAGFALQALHERHPTLATALAVATLFFPLMASFAYVQAIARERTRDRAADWIAAHAPDGARVLSAVPGLVVDTRRFELQQERLSGPLARVLARSADVLASVPKDEPAGAFEGLPVTELIEPQSPYEGPAIALRLVPPGARLVTAPVSLASARLDASAHPAALEALRDGRLDTYWEADAREAWIEARWPAPVNVARVELLLGARRHDAGRRLRLLASTDGQRFEALPTVRGRPSVRKQRVEGEDASEVLLFEPVRVRALRVERRGGGRQDLSSRWSIAELRLEAPAN